MNEDNLSSFTKHVLTHSFELHLRNNFYSTSGGLWRVYILSKPFMVAKISVLGLILSSYPYLRSEMVRFPLKMVVSLVCKVSIILFCEKILSQTIIMGFNNLKKKSECLIIKFNQSK